VVGGSVSQAGSSTDPLVNTVGNDDDDEADYPEHDNQTYTMWRYAVVLDDEQGPCIYLFVNSQSGNSHSWSLHNSDHTLIRIKIGMPVITNELFWSWICNTTARRKLKTRLQEKKGGFDNANPQQMEGFVQGDAGENPKIISDRLLKAPLEYKFIATAAPDNCKVKPQKERLEKESFKARFHNYFNYFTLYRIPLIEVANDDPVDFLDQSDPWKHVDDEQDSIGDQGQNNQ